MRPAILVLSDGSVFRGQSFGFEGEASGEVVFNTSITGYQEILTDPSYCKQIVVFTYPMIGNYGVNLEDVESDKVQAAGMIVKEYCDTPSHWRATESLGAYLKANKIVGVTGFPTREIVLHIRDKGAMPGLISVGEQPMEILVAKAKALADMAGQNLIGEVSCKEAYEIKPTTSEKSFIVAYDFGVKQNILRELSARGCRLLVVPHNTKASEILAHKPDGILLSNGPGDPAACGEVIQNIKELLGKKPILGICLGHQLLSWALGAETFKLKFGHRGGNQPVKNLKTGRVEITSQNHGFATSSKKIPDEIKVTHINLNDQTIEGFEHVRYPILSIQHHPEAAPGPHDASAVFDQFCEMMRKN